MAFDKEPKTLLHLAAVYQEVFPDVVIKDGAIAIHKVTKDRHPVTEETGIVGKTPQRIIDEHNEIIDDNNTLMPEGFKYSHLTIKDLEWSFYNKFYGKGV